MLIPWFLTAAFAQGTPCDQGRPCQLLTNHLREALGDEHADQARRIETVDNGDYLYGEVWTVPSGWRGEPVRFELRVSLIQGAWEIRQAAPACATDPGQCTPSVPKTAALAASASAGLPADDHHASLLFKDNQLVWRIAVPEPLIPGLPVFGQAKRRARVVIVNAHTGQRSGPRLELTPQGVCTNVPVHTVVLQELEERTGLNDLWSAIHLRW